MYTDIYTLLITGRIPVSAYSLFDFRLTSQAHSG